MLASTALAQGRQYQSASGYVNETAERQYQLGGAYLNDTGTAGPATSYAFIGPTSGEVNTPSTNFTVTPNGDATGIVVTPASDGAGSFTPASVTFTGSDPETFTYTPTSTTGSPHTLSVTDDGGLTDPASIDYTVTEPPPGTIACTDQTDGRIYQRVAGGTTKTVTIAGTYTDATPTTVEVELQDHTSGSVVQAYTALTSTTIGGGNWSGSLSVPQHTNWIKFRARKKDSGGSVLATSSVTSNKWGVGILVALTGQSNMERMDTASSTPPASSDLTRRFVSSWGAVTGNGAIRLANELQDDAGLLIGILPLGLSSTTIGNWTDTGHQAWTDFTTAVAASGNDIEFVLWHQGEGDAVAGTAKATYKAGLDTLYSRIRTLVSRNTTTLKFGSALLGNIDSPVATDATTQAIREGQVEWISETTGAFWAGSSVDMVRFDEAHWGTTYLERMGRRYAQAVLEQLGEVAFGSDGPRITSARRASGAANIRLKVTHDGGSSLEELDGSTDGGSLTGFQVSDDGFATTLTISSTAFAAGEIVLNLSAPPADVDTIEVRYQYGENPTITNPVYDNTTPQGDSVGLPLQPTVGSVEASLVEFPSDDLIAYFDCEEASGATLLDIHGIPQNGSNNGTVGSGTGILGNGRTVNANAANFIALPASFGFGATSGSPYTISGWFNQADTSTQVWIGRLANGKLLDLDHINGTGWRHAYGISPFDAVESGVVTATEWDHVVITFSSAGTGRLYVDGREVGTADASPTGDFTDAQVLTIGKRSGDNAAPANGTFDEIGIWGAELTPDEISDLYNSGIALAYEAPDANGAAALRFWLYRTRNR
jgi:hypothetical protein